MGQRLEDIRRLRERLTTGTLTGSAAQQERARLKNRILGVLLRDARQASGRSEADAAALLGIATEDYRAFESGAASPTLPQLEVLAYAYNVPMSHFWGSQTLADKRQEHSVREKIPAIIALRDRIVGIQIRQARERENLTVAQIAEETGIDARRLRDAERGRIALSVTELEILSQVLPLRISDMVDGHGPVGNWLQAQADFERFADLPADLRAFILGPINRSYLDLAIRMSEMDVEQLRSIAESILEITL